MSFIDEYQKLTGEITEAEMLLKCLAFRIKHDEDVDPHEKRELEQLQKRFGMRKLALEVRRSMISRRMRSI